MQLLKQGDSSWIKLHRKKTESNFLNQNSYKIWKIWAYNEGWKYVCYTKYKLSLVSSRSKGWVTVVDS